MFLKSSDNTQIPHSEGEGVKQNARDLEKFIEYCVAMGLSRTRILKYRLLIRKISSIIDKPFREAEREDLIEVVAWVERSEYSRWYKHDIKVVIKRFYKWLEGDDEYYPKKVRWLKTNYRRHDMPKEILSMREVHDILEAACCFNTRVLISLLWETGARIGELLKVRAGNVSFDDYGAFVVVDGKTGCRRIRVIESAGALKRLTKRARANKKLFPFSYNTYAERIKRCVDAAGITKRVTPHLFRHSRATYLANYLTEFQLKKMFGWTMSSDMPAVYVHLSGADVDTALLNVHMREKAAEFNTLKPDVMFA